MSGKSSREERREQRLQQESEVDRQDRRKRLLQIGSAAVFVVIVVVAVVIVIAGSGGSGSGGDVNLEDVKLVENQLSSIPQEGLVLGQSQAKVKLYEYGDLQCPVCKAYSEEIIPELINSEVRGGAAKIEFRNFTIIGPESTPAGAAAIAAGMQGKGWNYLELFYRNQGTERSGYVTDEFMTEVARGAGVPNIAQWNKDRKSAKVISEVEATTAEAAKLGFTGTPSFAVEGPGTSGKETLGTPGSAESLEESIEEAG
jgi:protein-disulfide isomerase